MPLIDPHVYGRFLNHDSVYKIWDRYDAAVKDVRSKDSTIKTEAMTRLNRLLDILENQEQAFYARYGFDGPNAIQQFQKKVDAWNQTGMSILLDPSLVYSMQKKINVTINTDEVVTVLNEMLQSGEVDIPVTSVADLVNTYLGLNTKRKFTEGTSQGLDTRYLIVGDPSTNKLQVTVAGPDITAKSAEKRLARLIEKPTVAEKLQNTIQLNFVNLEEVLTLLYDSIFPYVKDAYALQCLKYEFKRTQDKLYNYCSNPLVMQGWFAEMYWNAAFSWVFNKVGLTMPTGTVKNRQAKSLSVDMILNDAGFQIKSWHTNELIQKGTHTTSQKRQFGNFVVNNAGIPADFNLGQTLLDMFAAYSYNKPVQDEEYQNDIYEEYVNHYNTEYAFISNKQFDDLENIFRGYLDKIARIDQGGQLPTDEFINNQNEFFNTFWLINDKVYPSSVLIRNLIKRLESRAESSFIDFSIQSIRDNRSSAESWPYTNSVSDFNAEKLANSVVIVYNTTFDLGSLLKEIEKSG